MTAKNRRCLYTADYQNYLQSREMTLEAIELTVSQNKITVSFREIILSAARFVARSRNNQFHIDAVFRHER